MYCRYEWTMLVSDVVYNFIHGILYMKNAQTPDLSKMTDAFKKNAEAATAAAQMATESANTILRRYAEIAQKQMTASFDAMKDVASARNPEQAMARQQEYVKSAVEESISNAREIIDLTSKVAMEMFSSIGSKMSDTINDSLCTLKK